MSRDKNSVRTNGVGTKKTAASGGGGGEDNPYSFFKFDSVEGSGVPDVGIAGHEEDEEEENPFSFFKQDSVQTPAPPKSNIKPPPAQSSLFDDDDEYSDEDLFANAPPRRATVASPAPPAVPKHVPKAHVPAPPAPAGVPKKPPTAREEPPPPVPAPPIKRKDDVPIPVPKPKQRAPPPTVPDIPDILSDSGAKDPTPLLPKLKAKAPDLPDFSDTVSHGTDKETARLTAELHKMKQRAIAAEEKVAEYEEKIQVLKEKEKREAQQMDVALKLIEKNLAEMKTRAELAESEVNVLRTKFRGSQTEGEWKNIRDQTQIAVDMMQQIATESEQALKQLIHSGKNFRILSEHLQAMHNVADVTNT